MLYLVGFSYVMGVKIRSAMEIADRLLVLAAELKDPTLDMEAHRARGATLIEMGRCTEALAHFDRASHLYSANRRHPYTLLNIGHDCKVLSECFAGGALWALGFADAALERIQGALAFAKELSHPQSSVGAAHFACQLHQLRLNPCLRKCRREKFSSLQMNMAWSIGLPSEKLIWDGRILSSAMLGGESNKCSKA
jgi:tetratricopeptide (TPR) repeat protein